MATAFPDSHVLVAIAVPGNEDDPEASLRWVREIEAGGLTVQHSRNNLGDLSKVEFAVVWHPPPGLLAQCCNLKAVQLIGAGVDSVLGDVAIPPSLPLLRITEDLMAQRMATWVTWAVLHVYRRVENFRECQTTRTWAQQTAYPIPDVDEYRVGIMGLGVMGRASAKALHGLGFPVHAWVRSKRGPIFEKGEARHDFTPSSEAQSRDGVRCFVGFEELGAFAATSDVVVCLLPLTPETEEVLNASFFDRLKRGAAVVNAGRGGHCNQGDLLQALDDGRVSAAILDVTSPEPLPESSALWTHPRVMLFPHVSAITPLREAASQVLRNREALLSNSGVQEGALVDRARGY